MGSVNWDGPTLSVGDIDMMLSSVELPKIMDPTVIVNEYPLSKHLKELSNPCTGTFSIPVTQSKGVPEGMAVLMDRPKVRFDLKPPKLKLKSLFPKTYGVTKQSRRLRKKHGKTSSTSIRKRRREDFPKKKPCRLFRDIGFSFGGALERLDNTITASLLGITI